MTLGFFKKLFAQQKQQSELDTVASTPITRKKVVILGGGYAGASLARSLDKKIFEVVLIDNKSTFENKIGAYHVLVEPNSMQKNILPHQSYLHQANAIVGQVETITPSFVQVNGHKISFDYAVIATGSRYEVPFAQPSQKSATLQQYASNC